jgi:hypothetical protein
LEKVILTAIEKEPDKRFQSASEFHAALLRQNQRYGLALPAADGENAAARPRQPGEQQASRTRVLGGIGFDVFLIAAVALLALTLGLNPAQEQLPDEVEPVTRLTKNPRATPGGARAVSPANAVPRQNKAPPAHGRYDSLRNAWGG